MGVTAKRKRYCRRCKTRVSRSASRCEYCGRRLLGSTALALVALTAAALLSLFGRVVGFF